MHLISHVVFKIIIFRQRFLVLYLLRELRSYAGAADAVVSPATRAALVACVHKLRDRLPAADAIVALIQGGRLADAVQQLLPYYDKMYRKGLERRSDRVRTVRVDSHKTDRNDHEACEHPRVVGSAELEAYVITMTDALCRAIPMATM
jgi:hypothetical protein